MTMQLREECVLLAGLVATRQIGGYKLTSAGGLNVAAQAWEGNLTIVVARHGAAPDPNDLELIADAFAIATKPEAWTVTEQPGHTFAAYIDAWSPLMVTRARECA